MINVAHIVAASASIVSITAIVAAYTLGSILDASVVAAAAAVAGIFAALKCDDSGQFVGVRPLGLLVLLLTCAAWIAVAWVAILGARA